jgi:hypothetical protein
MHALEPQIDLVLLSNAFGLLAVAAVAFAAVGVMGALGLALAEWKQMVREDKARRQRILAASHAALAARL